MIVRVNERMDDTKVQDRELKWLYFALCEPTPINPGPSMVRHWVIQRNRNTGLMACGHYLTQIATIVVPDLIIYQQHLVLPSSIDESSLRNGRYIYGNEKSGYFVAGTKFKIPSPKIVLFYDREDWLEKFMFNEGVVSNLSFSLNLKFLNGVTGRLLHHNQVSQIWESNLEGLEYFKSQCIVPLHSVMQIQLLHQCSGHHLFLSQHHIFLHQQYLIKDLLKLRVCHREHFMALNQE